MTIGKELVQDFFCKRNYYLEENRSYQIALLHYFEAHQIEFYLFSESRNYENCIDVLLMFNSDGQIPVPSAYSDESTNDLVKLNFNNLVYFASIVVSDILPVCAVHWNVRNYDDNEKWPSEIVEGELPVKVLAHFEKIKEDITTQLNLHFLEPDYLDQRVTWLNETEKFSAVEYVPTLRELLFGGLDLYNKFNL